jgi:poly(3-hydroxybutyrate) depolymerase
MMTYSSIVLRVGLVVALSMSTGGAPAAEAEDSEGEKIPFIGTWELTSDWNKGGMEGAHVVSVNPDLTGTVEDLDEGWTSKLRGVELKGEALRFSFFFGKEDDYDVTFEGRLVDGEIKGEFTLLGAIAAVVGTPIPSAEAASPAPTRPSVFDIYEARTFTSSEGDTLPYRLFIPQDYTPEKDYPIVLFHHGGGATGSDNRQNLEGACAREWIRPDVQAKSPCFIVAPQIPSKDSKSNEGLGAIEDRMKLRIRTVHEIMDSLEEEFSIDTSREYVTGLSFGGECVWMSLLERPDRFAAAVPICATDGIAVRVTAGERGRLFAQLPLWIFHGDADKVVPVDTSRRMVKELKDAGGNPRYTEYPGVDHYSWDKAYRDPELIEWLFAQSRTPSLRL